MLQICAIYCTSITSQYSWLKKKKRKKLKLTKEDEMTFPSSLCQWQQGQNQNLNCHFSLFKCSIIPSSLFKKKKKVFIYRDVKINPQSKNIQIKIFNL